MTTIGVLALQGGVAEHLKILSNCGVTAVSVRRARELDDLDGLILPGGESTTIGKLLVLFELFDPLRARIQEGMGAFGTCAGAILLSTRALHHDGRPADQPLLAAMDTTVRRNAFGRQIDSFEASLQIEGLDEPMEAVFIRAPAIEEAGEGVDVLARVGDSIVVCRQGRLLASSFHPELAGDARLHQMFVEMLR